MTTSNSSVWFYRAGIAAIVIFLMISLVEINNARRAVEDIEIGLLTATQSIRLSKLGLVSIATDNLPMAATLFETSAAVEDAHFPVDKMTGLKAWGKLEGTLSAYAQRLTLLDSQSRDLHQRLQSLQLSHAHESLWLSLASFIAMTTAVVLLALGKAQGPKNKRDMRAPTPQL